MDRFYLDDLVVGQRFASGTHTMDAAEMQRIYAEQLPVLPLFFGSEAHVWPLWLKGVVPTGHGVTTLWAETWHAE